MRCALRTLLFALCTAAFVAQSSSGASDAASIRLERLAITANDRFLDLFPVEETMNAGAGPRQALLELTFSAEHRERQRMHYRWVLSQLKDVPLEELNRSERLTHQLLGYEYQRMLDELGYPLDQHYLLIQLDGGVANDLIRLVGRQPFRSEADYRAWMTRLQRYPVYLQGVARVLREGMEVKVTVPRAVLDRSLPQLDSLAPDEKEIGKSSLWKPMLQFPTTMDEASRRGVEAEYRSLLTDIVFPAIRKLSTFVRDEYMPRARTSDGLGGIPGGDKMYRLLVKEQTTTDMTPDEIHELGVKEVKRIQAKLLAAGEPLGFKGPLKDLRSWLRSKPENFPFTSGDEVLAYLNRINARIVPQLPKLFGRLPKARFEIRLTDPAIAAATPAQWYPPSDDGTRPGIFAIPIVDAKERSIFGLASLLAHEGMPGHHFDGSIQRENKVPEFRRTMWVVAFGEGWALYAESLGHELGLYDEPLALMGRYADELYRAGRLVVDTGLHAKGWPREKAMRFMTDECGLPEASATREVLRYMAWPAQALGYKIGELTILDIRAQAEKRLGKRFDIRAFHDSILGEGHLPLSMLREQMMAWIEEQARKPLAQ